MILSYRWRLGSNEIEMPGKIISENVVSTQILKYLRSVQGSCVSDTEPENQGGMQSKSQQDVTPWLSLVDCVKRKNLKNNLATDTCGWPWNSNIIISPKNFYQWMDRSVKFQGVHTQPDGPKRHTGLLTGLREGCRPYTDFFFVHYRFFLLYFTFQSINIQCRSLWKWISISFPKRFCL